jgi:hypothetical protein
VGSDSLNRIITVKTVRMYSDVLRGWEVNVQAPHIRLTASAN